MFENLMWISTFNLTGGRPDDLQHFPVYDFAKDE